MPTRLAKALKRSDRLLLRALVS